jgi:hypothetical protein
MIFEFPYNSRFLAQNGRVSCLRRLEMTWVLHAKELALAARCTG